MHALTHSEDKQWTSPTVVTAVGNEDYNKGKQEKQEKAEN